MQAWGWQVRGSCRQADPELFFHPDIERGAERQHRDAAALRICAECPVLRPCREYVLARREVHGVWGGLTEEQREEVWSRHRVGRGGARPHPTSR
nr:WhiB family transcriptional regulator [Kineococcus vitellinus]